MQMTETRIAELEKAVKELTKKVSEQTVTNKELKGKINTLEARLAGLFRQPMTESK